jgi:hypothetical protein
MSMMYVARWDAALVAAAVSAAAGWRFKRSFIPFVMQFDGERGDM